MHNYIIFKSIFNRQIYLIITTYIDLYKYILKNTNRYYYYEKGIFLCLKIFQTY